MKAFSVKLYAAAAVLLCAGVVVFGEVVLNAAISGFEMWLCCVMPSVFPFFVCVSLLKESGIIASSGSPLALFFGCAMSGAPAGSSLISALDVQGAIPQGKLDAYCAACNMVSPAFMTGSLFVLTGSREVILPVIIGHYGTALLFILLLSRKNKIKAAPLTAPCRRPFSQVLTHAVTDGFLQSVRICGVIVFFTVIIALCMQAFSLFGINSVPPAAAFFFGLLEMTNGVAFIAGFPVSFPLACGLICFTLSFGGLCVMVQTMAIINVNAKKYLLCKLQAGLCAGIIAYITALLLPQSAAAAFSLDQALRNSASAGLIALSSLLACGSVWLLCMKKRG